MRTPRTIKSALSAGYTFKYVTNYRSARELVVMQPRFYNAGMKAQISFWVSRTFARKINPEPLLNSYHYPYNN